MNYTGIRFDAPAGEALRWSDALIEAGALSVDVSDPAAGTDSESPQYGEPGEPDAALWSVSRIAAMFASDVDAETALGIAAQATALAMPPHEKFAIAEQDWVRATQSQFGPIRIADGFWIVPSWSAVPEANAVVLKLDPGLAFGTGSHPSTHLCLEWLHEKLSGGESVLDYGCGSGVLAIAAMKLGAGRAAGTDVDPQAMRASEANAAANDVVASFVLPDALAPGTFDVVVANILANPLLLLAPALAARVRLGGWIALSGILESQADALAAHYARWFKISPWQSHDGWVLLAGHRER